MLSMRRLAFDEEEGTSDRPLATNVSKFNCSKEFISSLH